MADSRLAKPVGKVGFFQGTLSEILLCDYLLNHVFTLSHIFVQHILDLYLTDHWLFLLDTKVDVSSTHGLDANASQRESK
jgi:hypothetical protein